MIEESNNTSAKERDNRRPRVTWPIAEERSGLREESDRLS